jgi:hypothetical protein
MKSSPRSTPRLVRALMAGGVAVLLLATGAAGAEERYPVRSTDDISSSFANRISAVGNILTPLDARVERISAEWFETNPGPPNAGSPFALAVNAVLAEADSLAADAAAFCSGEDIGIPRERGATIADDDTFAADGSTTGLTNQTGAVTIVLREADDRLKAISTDWFEGTPGPPDAPEQQELAAVYDAALGIALRAATILDQGYLPPSPCTARLAG